MSPRRNEVDGKSGVLDTYVDAVGFDYQPHDPEFGAACRHTRELETQGNAAPGQRISIDSLAQAPQQESRIEIGRFDPLGRVPQAPAAERVHHRAEILAGGREPILPAIALRARPPLDDAVLLQLAQPRHQHGPGNQRHAAMNVVEGMHAGYQLAQDQRRPARGKHLRRLRDGAELGIADRHAIHIATARPLSSTKNRLGGHRHRTK
jgi:hypothetical protein